MSQTLTTDADGAVLRRFVEELLSRRFGHPLEVESLTRRPSEFKKRTPVDIVRVTLATGQAVELFVKHLGFQVHRYRRHDRELLIYEELFSGNGLPVATCYGARWNEATREGLLVLEYISGSPLHHHGLSTWVASARSLAAIHGHFAARRDELMAADFLLRIDADYLWTWAERAVAGVAESYPAELARRVERLATSWERVVERIASQPVTLVHNHLSPKNVVVSTATVPARICFVDWEMAGVGCALEDLVHLRYQRLDAWSDRAVLDEYAGCLAGTGLLPTKPRELRELVAACELQRIVYKLGRSGSSGRTVEDVAHRVGYAERLWSRLGGR